MVGTSVTAMDERLGEAHRDLEQNPSIVRALRPLPFTGRTHRRQLGSSAPGTVRIGTLLAALTIAVSACSGTDEIASRSASPSPREADLLAPT